MEGFFAIRDITKTYHVMGVPHMVLPGVSFSMKRGEILALLGPSGCGKSTLLNILAGFESPDRGNVLLEGRPCVAPGPDRAVVFQEDALFSWLTAMENITLGLRAAGLSLAQCRKEAERMLTLTGLGGFGYHLPRMMSGGMRQRLALARVLALSPKVLLMDEPFAALDAITRENMHDLVIKLHQCLNMTVLFVTHDVHEAVKLADTILVMGEVGSGILKKFQMKSFRPRDEESIEAMSVRKEIRISLTH